jgi:hypothetical protein
MEEVKKDTGEVKVEETTPVAEEPKKKKGGKTVLTILLVLFVLLLLCGLGGYFGLRNYITNLFEEAEEQTIIEEEQQEDPFEFFIPDVDEDQEEGDLPEVENDMEGEDLITERFPEDIPLSGGRVIASSFDQWSVKVDIQTSSSVEDAYLWYEEALEDTDWIVTSKSRDDGRANIEFNNGEDSGSDDFRRGDVSILRYDWRDYTEITIRERY